MRTCQACSFNKSTLFDLFRLLHMPRPRSSFLPSWTILSKYALHFRLYIFIYYSKIRSTHANPIHCFKADTQSRVRVIIRVQNLPGDNPQQSEEASHMGGSANHKSRKSTKGGPHEVTESNEGYHELYTVSCHRAGGSFVLTYCFSKVWRTKICRHHPRSDIRAATTRSVWGSKAYRFHANCNWYQR